MNRGSIPGYYFDEEKKKYFKVLPHHKAPTNAKYSKSNAVREQKEAKRRKVENHERLVLRSQTVIRHRLLDNPLIGGGGILREHGAQSSSVSAAHQAAAVAQGLGRCGDHQFIRGGRTLVDLHRFEHHLALGMSYNTQTVVFRYERLQSEPLLPVYRPEETDFLFLIPHERLVATCSTTISGTPYMLACASASDTAEVRFCDVATPIAPIRPTLWILAYGLYSCTINQTTNDVAFAGSRILTVRNMLDHGNPSYIALPEYVESSAVEWVDANTVAFGSSKNTYSRMRKVFREHAVMLWDIRVNSQSCADATALRLTSRQRVTGIERPDESGNNLVVTTNHSITLHDLRNLRKDRPVLSFDHQSEGMTAHTSIYHGDLLAAIDEQQRIQIYSLRLGKRLKTFANKSSDPVRNVRWFEDGQSSPSLQACCGHTVRTWSQV
ncbi:hypothetical protein TI39_contig290g00021 [Zymoseptoria brevis]|uniref:Uncharacterized protein n=1 Tax=Zymoseptoria brevis TaxID=1047168 RepID=A0A0F4GZ26_9PEZI|nr:hypothetical protein TI39_contig290g00021 [Zymoseptoria brevis]